MGHEPTFSVVIPAYNAADTVADAISSVLAQTDGDFELIVVDDGSSDNTSGEVGRFAGDSRVRYVHQANVGLAATRNRALAEARGHYASFLDSDDLMMPSYLATMRATLESAGDVAFADCDFWILEDSSGHISTWPLGGIVIPRDPHDLMRLVLRGNVLHYGATVRMSVLREAGYFNPSLRACEDVELWLRILARGHAAVRAPGRLAVYRSRSGSLSTNATLMTRSLCEVYRLVAEEYDVPETIRTLAGARRRAEERRLAALTGERRLGASALSLRRKLAPLRRLLRAQARREIPTEVAAAFPKLARARVGSD
jgi:glycosyltransferase involved in cell wall biosynthesis